MNGRSSNTELSVENVGHVFRSRGVTRVALVDVTFDLVAGQTIAVVGESGAGKTTLARLVAGLERPSSGRILVGGQPPKLKSGTPSPVQMVFQDPADALNPFHAIRRSVAAPLRKLSRTER